MSFKGAPRNAGPFLTLKAGFFLDTSTLAMR